MNAHRLVLALVVPAMLACAGSKTTTAACQQSSDCPSGAVCLDNVCVELVTADAGPGIDAGTRPDAGTSVDAGPVADAGPAVDAGVDAGPAVDAGIDAGPTVDAGITVPGAPTNVSASAGDGQATVTWSAPTDTGDSVVLGYVVTAGPGGATASAVGATNNSATVTGLTNGQSYTFTVVAVSEAGQSASSAASNSVTPTGLPGAPVIVSLQPGDGTVTVTWTGPSDTGGLQILNYEIVTTGMSPPTQASGSATSQTIGGLTDGTSYTFSVYAVNMNGAGPPSATSVAVTPAGVPGQPAITSVTPGDQQITVTWTDPASNGGSAILAYTITASPGNIATSVLGAGATTGVLGGLSYGVSYTVAVTAVNTVGPGQPSVASNPFTLATVPGVPIAVSATVGIASATISWSPPANASTSAITGYTVVSSPPTTMMPTTGTSVSFTGLTPFTQYSFSVYASGASGPGATASSNQITVLGPAVDATSAVTGPSAPVTADGLATAALQVSMQDANGDPLPDQPVLVSVTGVGYQLLPPSGTTGSNGVFRTTLSSTLPGTRTITVTSGAVTKRTTVTFASTPCANALSFSVQSGFQLGTEDQEAWFAAAAPFTGDGALDLAFAVHNESTTELATNNGSAGLTLAPDSPFPSGPAPSLILTIDFNNDGQPDVAVVNSNNLSGANPGGDASITVLLNDGMGGFAAASGSPLTIGEDPIGLALADFNNDGNADVAAFGLGGLFAFLGDGTGNFTTITPNTDVTFSVSGSSYEQWQSDNSMTAGDFNGDQAVDLAVATGSAVSILLGDGQGNFNTATQGPIMVTPGAVSIATADFNGDGSLDLVTSSGPVVSGDDTAGFSVLLGDGEGNFAATAASPVGFAFEYGAVAVGDMNGDGIVDVVSIPYGQVVYVALGDGTGNFTISPAQPLIHQGNLFTPVLGDLSGSGSLDIVTTTDYAATAQMFLNTCNQ